MKISDLFLSFKNNHHFPQLLIIQNQDNKLNQLIIANNYLKSLVCDSSLYCDQCKSCDRINKNHYLDFIYLDNLQTNVKKEDILNIQNQFWKESFEQKKVKLYVINDIENVNKQSLNTLLKFLEEPPKDTYALFFCKNYNLVLDTIKSRGYFVNLNYLDNHQYLNEDLEDDELFKLQNELINLKFNQTYNLLISIKKLTYPALNRLINYLIQSVSLVKKIKLMELKQDLKLNLNKSLLAYKILEIIQWEQ